MPRLLIKQRVFSWTDTYDVYGRTKLEILLSKEFLSLTIRSMYTTAAMDREVGAVRENVQPDATVRNRVGREPKGHIESVSHCFVQISSKYE